MPGTSLVAVSDVVQPGGVLPARARSPIRRCLAIGLALGGWIGFLLLAGILLLVMRPAGPGGASLAGNADGPSLLIAPVVVAEPWVPTPIPIQIGAAPSLTRTGWIRMTGVPGLASLSSGHTIGNGIWKVPLSGLPSLTITAPNRGIIRSVIRIALMSAEGLQLAEVQSALAVMPAAMCGAEPVAVASMKPDDVAPGTIHRPSDQRPLAVLTTGEDRRRMRELILQGEIHRSQGRIESARGYYERAADMGSPRAALALAATYDPHEITGTVRPHAESARAWYGRARDLMDAAVELYLGRLEAPPAPGELQTTRLRARDVK